MTRIATRLALFMLLASVAVPAAAQSPERTPDQILAELKDTMAERYPVLAKLKAAAKVGETYEGLVGVVKPEFAKQSTKPGTEGAPTIGQVVDAENKDRRALFAALAKKTEVAVAEVAKQNVLRNFKRAKPTEYLLVRKGTWMRKQDFDAARKRKKK